MGLLPSGGFLRRDLQSYDQSPWGSLNNNNDWHYCYSPMILRDCDWVLHTHDVRLTFMECLPCARHHSLHFSCMSLLHPHENPGRELPLVSLFMGEEAEAQRGPVPGPRHTAGEEWC